MAGEPDDLLDLHTLCVRCQVADLHIFDHTATKPDRRREHRLAVELSEQA
jgi:hypothetical protein